MHPFLLNIPQLYTHTCTARVYTAFLLSPRLPQPTKLNQADEVVNYLAIEPLERRSEVQLKVTSAAGQRAVVVIPEDNSVEGQNMVSIYT